MKKKLISLLLTAVMLLMLIPTTAFAYDAPTLNLKANYDTKTKVVTLKVTMGAVSNLGALDYHVKYDATKLEAVSGSLVGKNFLSGETAVLNVGTDYVAASWSSMKAVNLSNETEIMEVKDLKP